MSLHSFLHRGAAPAPPKRITIRRRLLGRGGRLPAAGMAAGLLSLGLASVQPAQAGMATWNGPATVTDWYSQPSFWTGGSLISNGFDYPGSGDDAVNSAFNAPMSLGADATVNSFFSNSAFTLNGGTFSGSQANAASMLTVNNLFTLNGGTINNFTVNGTQQAGGPAASVLVTSSGGNVINNSIINSNLDLATTPGAFLDILGATTANGTISLANGSNLRLRNDGTTLTLGSGGLLQGAGTINQFGSTAFINNGTVNANSMGNTLSLALTNFNSSGLMEAANGGILSLQNTNTNNSGAVSGTNGGIVSITGTFTGTGTAAQGNLITASGGGQVQVNGATVQGTLNGVGNTALIFNGSGGNIFNGVTSNINLDLVTTPGAFLDILGATTESRTISLAGTGDLRLRNDGTALTLGTGGLLQGAGTFNQYGSTAFINNGTVNANLAANAAGNTLNLLLTSFTNNGLAEATNGGILSLQNSTTTNSGSLVASGGGTINLTGTLQSNAAGSISTVGGAGTTGGTFNVQGATVLGTVNGVGASSLVFNGAGGNIFNGVTSNINLDLATNSGAFLDVLGATTESKTITLAGTGNLRLRNDGTTLTLGSTGVLQGAGTFNQYGSTAFINNGTVNANLPTNAAGNTLTTALTSFTNNGLTEATNGATLALQNSTTTNSGSLVASGGGVINLASTTFQGNAAGSISTVGGAGTTGGTFNVQGTTLLGTLNGVGNTALIFNTSGGNILDGTLTATNPNGVTSNINLDLVTTPGAFLDILGATTANGTISLANGSNLRLRNDGTALTLGSGGLLQGAGTFNQYGNTAFINNGTVNANLPTNAAGNTLTTALTSFTNNSLTEATNGGILSLQNTNTNNNAGSTLAATGAGSLVTIQGTFTGAGNNLITASGGGQVQVNGATLLGTLNTDTPTALIFNSSGSNIIDGGNSAGGVANINANLDLASNGSAFLDVLGAATESKTITLAGNGDLRLRNDNTALTLGSTGVIQGSGTVNQFGLTTLNNGGTVSANVANQTLNINTSNFNNTGTATAVTGATLSVTSNTTNSGTVSTQVGATETFSQGLTQTAGLTQVFGVLNASETLNGGNLVGSKTINGNIVNNGGIVQPVVGGPGFTSLNINGNFTQGSGGELDAFFGNYFHNLLNVSGQTTTGGTLGVFDLDQTPFTGTGSTGSQFTFLDYSGTLTPDGSTVNGFTQYFTNEIPDSNNSGTILGQNGFKYELLNDTVNKQLDIQIVTVGAPVPEASTTVSLGLLLALGLGGMVIAAKRKKSA